MSGKIVRLSFGADGQRRQEQQERQREYQLQLLESTEALLGALEYLLSDPLDEYH